MAETIDNPYAKERHELMREFESGKVTKESYEQKLQELLIKEKELLEDRLIRTQENLAEVLKSALTKRELYKQLIIIYRQGLKICAEAKAMKKEMREQRGN